MTNPVRAIGTLWPAAALLVMASPAAAQSACTLNKVVEIPVVLSKGHALTEGLIDGHKLSFLIDSGYSYSTIDQATAQALNLDVGPAPNNLYIKGVGGNANPRETHVKDFRVAGVGKGLGLGKRAFLVLPTGGFAGIIGQDVLGMFDVEYDFPHGAVRLFQSQGCRDVDLAYWDVGKPFATVAIDLPDRMVARGTYGSALLNGARIKVQFDTGAETSVMTAGAAARAKVKPGDDGVKPGGMIYGTGQRQITVWRGRFASFTLGDEELKNVDLNFGDVSLNNADMLLGADFFLSHRVFVSNQQHKAYITYEGGPLFGRTVQAAITPGADGAPATAAAAIPNAEPEPQDAASAYRRASVLNAQGDRNGALAELGRAIALAPNNPAYLLTRAQARIANRQPALAMEDLDKALSLAPTPDTYLLRAQLRLSERDNAGAVEDIDAASRLAPETSDLRTNLGDLDRRTGRFDVAVAEYGHWIEAHPKDARLANALIGRCLARALPGAELDKALSDCNQALSIAPNTAVALQTRAIVWLKSGNAERSIADYDATLKIQPKDPLSLYGRGLAKLKKGLESEGQADLAAATTLQPRVADQAKAIGLAKTSP
jgi:tetratricopeptide (TPR) repeat protein